MKLKSWFFTGCLLLLSGLANAQFWAELFYNEGCNQPGLTELCGFTGDVLPDGTNIEIFWDANGNGPDTTDLQPVVGTGFGQCNFNSFSMNGLEILGCEGGFYSLEVFTIPTSTPQPSRYWLRVCVPGQDRYWRTNSFTITSGYQAINTNGQWVCVEEPCLGCIAAPEVVGFQASENSCSLITLTWSPYTLDPDVDSLLIYRSSLDTLIETAGRTNTPFVDDNAPFGEYAYMIRARKISDGDTCFSNMSFDNGTRYPFAVGPASCLATDDRCGQVIVSWTNPNNVTTVDSFKILRNGVEVGNQIPGILGQPNSDTIAIDTDSTDFFTVSGWNVECGLGATSAGDSGRAAIAPATPTGVTATVGECAVTIRWNRVTGATAYRVVRDGVTTVGTPTDTFQVHEPPSPQTLNAYTVIAINEPNPTACEESGASVAANGSDIDTPNAPTSPSASDSTSCAFVQVTWTDNSSNELGFIIQRGGIGIDSVGPGAGGVISFNDSTATPGTIYSYAVASYNLCGTSAFVSAGSGSRKRVPQTPLNVNASVGECELVIGWSDITDETGYRIYRDGALRAAVAANVTQFTDDFSLPYTNYSYTVSGYNDCNEGVQSFPVFGNRVAAPATPTNVATTTVQCGQILITWQDVPNEDGYILRRDGSPIASLAGNTTQYTDTGIAGAHSYRVQALNLCGASIASSSVFGQTEPSPEVLVLAAGEADCQAIDLSFSSSPNTDTVKLYRDNVLVSSQAASSGTYLDVPSPGTYTYSAEAIGDCGVSAIYGNVPGTLLAYPSGPTELVYTSDSCSVIHVSWTPAEGDFGSYRVQRDASDVAILPNSATTYDDPNAIGGITYAYVVTAVNDACGESTPADTVLASISLGAPPTAPTVTIITEALDAVLTWPPVDTTVVGCLVMVSRYLVFFSENGQGPFYFHGSTTETNYRHVEVLRFASDMFYHVESFVGDVQVIANLPTNGTLTRDDVARITRR